MPRTKKGSPPAYREHKATGQAVVTVNGRDVYLGLYGSPKSLQQYGLILAGNARPVSKRIPSPEPEPTTVEEVLAAYWEHATDYYRKNGKPTNEIAAMRVVARDLRTIFGETPAADFGPMKLKAVRQLWIDRGQARTTINKNARRLSRIFRWAVAEELVPGSVYEALRAVAGLKRGRTNVREPDPIEPVPVGVVERTIPFLPKVTADMVRFQLLTGARPGEGCGLRPCDVDRSKDVWEYRVQGHKTEHHGRERIVYIGPEAQAVLTPYLLRAEDTVCFSMAESVEQRQPSSPVTEWHSVSNHEFFGEGGEDRRDRSNLRQATWPGLSASSEPQSNRGACCEYDDSSPARAGVVRETTRFWGRVVRYDQLCKMRRRKWPDASTC